MTHYLVIGGTHWSPNGWCCETSPLTQFLFERGLMRVGCVEWSGREVVNPHLMRDWYDGADKAAQMLLNLPFEDRNVIAHSHGGQVALMASRSVRLRRLLTIGTPNRADVPKDGDIERWRHVRDPKFDLWATLGQLFDMRVSLSRKIREADDNVAIPGVRHGRLLDDPGYFQLWIHDGLVDFLR